MEQATFLNGNAADSAARLIGCELWRDLEGETVRLRIVETEAYDQTDAASHSYRGRTPRTDVMFGPSGRLYVYFTYGMHYCCNITVGQEGVGAAVLIRAVETLGSADVLTRYRTATGIQLTNGPAKLCQAADIDRRLNGHDLRMRPLRLVIRPALAASLIGQSPRIGITRDVDTPWRFFEIGNPYVSK